jgi:hypothetical protein
MPTGRHLGHRAPSVADKARTARAAAGAAGPRPYHRRARSRVPTRPRRPVANSGIPRAKSRQSCCRWSASARNRCRPSLRCTRRMVASATDAGVRALMSFRKSRSSDISHNRLLGGSSPASSTTQSCANLVSCGPRKNPLHSATFAWAGDGVGVARLFDAPAVWSRQHQMLGFLSSA